MSDGLLKLFFYLRRKTGSFLFEVFFVFDGHFNPVGCGFRFCFE